MLLSQPKTSCESTHKPELLGHLFTVAFDKYCVGLVDALSGQTKCF